MARWTSSARLVINLPDLDAYEDTLQVVGCLSRFLRCCYVLTVHGQSLSEEQRRRWPSLYLINLPRRRFPARASAWVARAIEAEEVDIIHDLFGHLAPVCERVSTSEHRPYILIHTQRTTNWGWFERVRPLKFQIDMRYASQRARSLWYDSRILHAVDHVTVMGPGHELDLKTGHGISEDKVSFVPSETDCKRFSPQQTTSTQPHPTLLYTGALVRAKGLDLLLDLFAELGRERTELRLSLIGRETPFDRRWLHKRLRHHPLSNRIDHSPPLPRKDLLEHYQRAVLYLFPSLFEGSPRSLREALSCGLPAVATDIPGHRGIDPQGHFIHFAPVNDLNVWLTRTREALDEEPLLKANRIQRGVQHLNQYHRPEAVASHWLTLYQSIAHQRGLIPNSN